MTEEDRERAVEAIGNAGWKTIGSLSARRKVVDIVAEVLRLPGSALRDEIRHLIINTPETCDFMSGVPLEAVHQRERWPSGHDGGKAPEDWLFLVGYLAGKACSAQRSGDIDKAMHHTISAAAALANWHAALTGRDTRMRPGIEPPVPEASQ